jgi:hypothetical protein
VSHTPKESYPGTRPVFAGVELVADRTARRKAFTVRRRTTLTTENPYADLDWEAVESLHLVREDDAVRGIVAAGGNCSSKRWRGREIPSSVRTDARW